MRLREYLLPLLFILFACIPLVDLLHSGVPYTHDGRDHVVRIANFYENLEQGVLVPRWAANLNWGYGHPILMFLYPFPSYATSFFHSIGFSFEDSVKLVFAFSYIASGFGMYMWLKQFLKQPSAFLGGILYIFAPYRFVDFYVRGAIGEHVAFLFLPLVLYFLLKISVKKSPWYILCAVLSLAGLILSHNAISLMFMPILLFYIVFLVYQKKWNKDLLIKYIAIFLLSFGIAAFFWMPALLEGKYTLRDIVTKNEYKSRFVEIGQLIYGPWSYGGTGQLTVQIGILQWVGVLFSLPSILYLYKKKNNLWILTTGMLVIFTLSLFIMLPFSDFIWQKLKVLQNFQFPWRFLSISVFTSAFLCSIVCNTFLAKMQNALVIVCLVGILFFYNTYWRANGYFHYPHSYYASVYQGTTDTGESAPIWSIRFMEKAPKKPVEVIAGKAQVLAIKRKTIYHTYTLDVVSASARIRENTLYFPGWKVLVDGKEVPIEFQDPKNRGLMTYMVTSGKHSIEVIFTDTKLRLAAGIVSIGSLVMLCIYTLLLKKR